MKIMEIEFQGGTLYWMFQILLAWMQEANLDGYLNTLVVIYSQVEKIDTCSKSNKMS